MTEYTPLIDTDNLLEPKYTIDINGVDYVLDGSYGRLKDVQTATNIDLGELPTKVVFLNPADCALILKALGNIDLKPIEIEEWIFHINTLDQTKLLLIEFLMIACSQKKTEVRLEAQNRAIKLIKTLLDAMKQAENSLGKNTSDSA